MTPTDIASAAQILNSDGVAILPTDTIYGMVGRALSPQTVERIYSIKQRRPEKPYIILVSSLSDLAFFEVGLGQDIREFLQATWPERVSVILPCPSEKFSHLHRGKYSLAFRMPKHAALLQLLERTGPLVAPSANPEGLETAKNIQEAKNYFGDQVDLYLDGGTLVSPPSTLITFVDGKIKILRQGAFVINSKF